jgi:uncharacterized membrane protein
MTSHTARRRVTPADWLVPAGLIALSLVPIAAGAARVSQLAAGAAVTADNVRFFDSPIPVIAHIVGSSVYLLLGAMQFSPALRRRAWHRRAGRIAASAGLVSALSAIWMTLFYDLPSSVTGPGLSAIRLVLATAMIGAIVAAVVAIRRGDVPRHRAWMTRAYAIGLGAGTQVLVLLPWTVFIGTPGPVVYTVLMGAGWAINLVVAEVAIRRAGGRTASRSPHRPATAGARLS